MDDQEVTSLASVLCPEVEKTVGHQEVWCWEMLLRLLVDAVDQSHLAQAVPQSVILLLFTPKVPFPRALVKHRGDWVRVCECLT